MNLRLIGLTTLLVATFWGCSSGDESSHERNLPLCEFLGDFPQNPQDVEREFGVPAKRVVMPEQFRCYTIGSQLFPSYYAFIVKDGDEISVRVPEGGYIMQIFGSDGFAATYIEEDITGTEMLVAGMRLTNN